MLDAGKRHDIVLKEDAYTVVTDANTVSVCVSLEFFQVTNLLQVLITRNFFKHKGFNKVENRCFFECL